MNATLSRASRLLCATTLALVLLAAPAYAVDTPFAPRFAQTVQGDIATVGNTLMTCPTAAAGCTTAQGGSGRTLNNNSYVMGYVDVDADATTFDSSSATVALPGGSTVLWAGLYWAADTTAGTGGGRRPDPREPRHRAPEGRRRRLPDRHGRARRHPHLHLAAQPLPRVHRRHRRRGRRRQRHLHGRRTSRPARATTASPAGRCSSPTATTTRRSAACTSTTAWARSTRRTPSRPRSRRSTRRPARRR